MKKLALILAAASAVVLACIGLSAIPVHADPPQPAPPPASAAPSIERITKLPPNEDPLLVTTVVPGPSPIEAPGDNGRHERLRSYILEVMNGWTHAVPQVPTADYGDVASDIGYAVLAEADDGTACSLTPTFKDGFRRCLWGPGWNTDHAKAVMLAAVGYWEGARYAAYVDELKCQDDAWRVSPEGIHLMHIGGDCDHKHAHSLFQIHPLEDPASPLYAICNTKMVDNSRVDAARCALALIRRSVLTNGTLSGYTGEYIPGEHPKADVRLDFAKHALDKHPFTLPQE